MHGTVRYPAKSPLRLATKSSGGVVERLVLRSKAWEAPGASPVGFQGFRLYFVPKVATLVQGSRRNVGYSGYQLGAVSDLVTKDAVSQAKRR